MCFTKTKVFSSQGARAASRIGFVLNPNALYARAELHREQPQPFYYP